LYSYDALNRLTAAVSKVGIDANRYDEKGITYDKNGNILTLQRTGLSPVVTTMDNLKYTYDTGNKLVQVFDSSLKNEGFTEPATHLSTTTTPDYNYDLNGNMLSDLNKGITTIKYNHLNLPTKITFSGTNKIIDYLYTSNGQKVYKKVTNGTAITETNYLSGFQYQNGFGGSSFQNIFSLQFFPTSEGYINADYTSNRDGSRTFNGYSYVYNYTDHLGNVRLSYSDKNKKGSVQFSYQESYWDSSRGVIAYRWASDLVEENNYYPFGLKHKGYNDGQVQPNYKYAFGGKERQTELGLDWSDFGARNYDATLGRWMNMDPLSEKYFSFSPFNYCLNNPILFIDPDGKDIIVLVHGMTTDTYGSWNNHLVGHAAVLIGDAKVGYTFYSYDYDDGVNGRGAKPIQKPMIILLLECILSL